MKTSIYRISIALSLLLFMGAGIVGDDEISYEKITSRQGEQGRAVDIYFKAGDEYNYPLAVFWVEDMQGNYLYTLFAPNAIAKGIFGHGDKTDGVWKPGHVRRPAALPYWAHKRGVKAPDGLYYPTPETAMPDAVSGATPGKYFVLSTRIAKPETGNKLRLLMEINQTWDWNKYWHNSLYPDNEEYKTSCQPSLVYAVTLDFDHPEMKYYLNPIGHGHYAGENGFLYTNLGTHTTALEIADQVWAELPEKAE